MSASLEVVFQEFAPVAAQKSVALIQDLLERAIEKGASPRMAVPLVAEEIIESAVSFAISMSPAINATPDQVEKLLRVAFEESVLRAHRTAAEVHEEMRNKQPKEE